MSINCREDLLNRQAKVNEEIKSYTAFLSVPVPAVSHPVLRKFMKKWKFCVGISMVLP